MLAVDDAIDENDESVTLGFGTLPNGVSKIQGTHTAKVTLGDNDTRGVVVSLERLRVTEGNSEDYTVVLRSEPTAAVTVQVTTDLAGTGPDGESDEPDVHGVGLGCGADGGGERS